ncbi:MAG: MFS transporter [Rhodobiaceae bacterium]|nr:MFS transporter [Rhodobiaceae bacterium]MCC0052749.1 MFS transporter [Rhodobiaceae bacterium]
MRLDLILALSLAGLGSNISLRLVDPLVPTIAGEFGLSVATVATLATAYALPYAIFQPVLGPVGDAIGKSLLIRASLIVLASGLVACALAPNFPALVMARMVCGIAAGGIIPAAFALIGDRIPMAERQLAISRLLLLIFIAQIAGAGGAGALSTVFGWRGVLLTAALVTGSVALVTFSTFSPRPDAVRKRPSLSGAIAGYREVFSNPIALPLYLLTAVEGASVFATHPYVAAVLHRREGVGAFEAGMVIGSFGVGALAYTLCVQWLLAHLGPKRMAVVGSSGAGLALCLFALGGDWRVDCVLFFAFGFAFLMLHNPLQAVATEVSTKARGSAVAMFALALFLGQAMGPPIFGFASALAGTTPMIIVEAAIIASLGVVAARRIFASHVQG